jgi:hypothetical protein
MSPVRIRRQTLIRSVGAALVASAVLLGSACATPRTTLDAQWVDPAYAGRRAIRSLMVMAVVRDATNRRIFEDRMVSALGGVGVTSVQSYKSLPEEGPVAEERLRRAVADAGVTHVLATRLINVSTRVDVSPGMVMGPGWGPGWGGARSWGPGWPGFRGYYGTMWATTIPPQITTTQSVHADTRVFDAANAAVLWSAATTTSTGSDSIPQLIDQFVQLIVATLKNDGMI